jgi:hypothetical protein
MKKLNSFFKIAVQTLETERAPISSYFLLYLAILGIRLTLEFFSNQRLFRWEDALHIGLWFTVIVQVFIVLLQAFSKEDMQRVVRTVVCSFSIALTAPIIDLVVSQGHFSRMNYLSVQSFSDVVYSFFTIGGASLTRGATLGIRIEIVLLILASFNYIRIKQRSTSRAILGTFIIYTFLFLSGLIPQIILLINSVFNLKFQTDDLSTINFLLVLNIPLFIWILQKLITSRNLQNLFSWTRFLKLSIWVAIFVLGCYQAHLNYSQNWTLNPSTIFHFPLIFVAILLLLFWDTQITIFNPTQILFGLLLLTLVCSFQLFFIGFLIWSCTFILNNDPLKFKKLPLLNPLFSAIQTTAFTLFGFVFFGGPMIGFDSNLLLIVLLLSFSVYLLIDYRSNNAPHDN